MSNPFNDPKSSNGFVNANEHIGHLVCFVKVHRMRERTNDLSGRQEIIADVDFADIDGDGQIRHDVTVTNQYIVEKLEVGIDNVLGVIQQLPPKKPGYKGAIILVPVEKDDTVRMDKALRWWNTRPTNPFTDPLSASLSQS